MVGWCVGHQQQVVWRVLVVRGHEQGDKALQELLTLLVEREERVAADVIQLAVGGHGAAAANARG